MVDASDKVHQGTEYSFLANVAGDTSVGTGGWRRARFQLRALYGKAAAYLRDQRAFSLIEVLVAVGILGVIGTSVVMALETNFRAARTLDEQVVAVNPVIAHIQATKACHHVDMCPTEDCLLDRG